ncbi:hypothetical protein LH935_06210 [Gordonia polyisoprenivorans]|uniref:hypothetical protein n=1 Tax=Gordonia polyisoprenivorans TaxID=84595 RepID=UPI0022342C9A|nr:hypothetical protein LH935_06210 [Gordonia polyisoprenivorans]
MTDDNTPHTDESRAARETVDDLERKITHNPAEDDDTVVDPESATEQPGTDDPAAGDAEPAD